ncbi:origin recognition complex subunit 2-domain-containing protein [Panaeolus papilionaceus]|nr:origin recognition complex subunit 2-domain-containing protein [Panaeolus papilionaceus]
MAHLSTNHFHQHDIVASDEEDEEEEDEVEEELEAVSEDDASGSSEDDALPSLKSKGKGKRKAADNQESKIIVQTAFDAYFTANKAGRVQTSSNVYSDLVLPLSAEEYGEAMKSLSQGLKPIKASVTTEQHSKQVFSRMLCEIQAGFNILCYGLGSKRQLLNRFARDFCSKRGHVVVGNGFQPDFHLKDLLNSIESIPALQKLDLSSTTVEKQASRINDFFSRSTQKAHLFIIIHNVDAAPLRNSKAKSILSLLAHNPKIHLIASIDHTNAPMLWTSSEIFARKPPEGSSSSSKGFAWLWHDLTTLASYDFELAFVDRTSLSGAHTGGARKKVDTLAAQNATAMSETAASHILASVTQKAKKLFALLGQRQLDAIEGTEDASLNDLQQYGMAYDVLFSSARDNFIATSDTALRSLLGEFRDHSLIVSAQSTAGSGEILWIPMRKERLANVLRLLDVS